jgi:hypothetical protein
MKIGEMRDAQAVELGREPRNLDLELAEPYPTGLEPAPCEAGGCRSPQKPKGTGAAPEGNRAGFRPSVH